ncbi:hypothetical protein EJO68_32990 [Variovorax atrisoli]|uniref:hypothetical protein n=1 Tax=Variovorax atrisoli TaxID=3394203 RepID=UPI000F7E5976|nr:hypothetical protein [Variovorax sp. 369]RTD84276.1 hypothetical protein EJO68_32990 [Variovorax sp. 369]
MRTGIEKPKPADPERLPFIYRGWRFEFSARPVGSGCFEPVVVCLGHGPRPVETRLPNDTDEIAYATRAEAMRHAQQQAMRWVHDRTGDGQGQF